MSSAHKGRRSPAADKAPTPSADAQGSVPIPFWLARTTPEPANPDLEPIFAELVDALESSVEVAE